MAKGQRVGRWRGSQPCVVDPRPGAGAPRRRSDPAASLGDLWSVRDLRVGRRRRRQALVVDPRPLRGQGPSPTKPRRCLHGPSVRSDRSSVGRWRGSQARAPIPEQKTLGAPRRARDPAASLGARWMAKGLRVGRRRRRQALVVDPRPLRGQGPSPTKPRRGLFGCSVRCARPACRPPGGDRKRASSIPGHGPGPLADAATPRPHWATCGVPETCVSAARRRRQALVVDPRPLRRRGPSPTKPRRGLFGPSVRCDRSSVGRWRGSQPCAPIPEQKTLGAPRRARDPATTSTPREQRRERTRSAERAGNPT